jgi:hypothetical protein
MNEVVLEKKFELGELLDLRVLGEPLRNLADMIGIQIRIYDLAGKELFDTGGEIHFCQVVHQADMEDQICRSVREKLITQPLTGSSAAQILAVCGSRYTVLPITHQFDLLGRVVLGPYQDHGIADSRLSAIAAQYRIDSAKFISAYKKLPNPSPEQIKKIARFNSKILDAFVFINTKRLLTSLMHLELMMQSKDRIFKEVEKEMQSTPEDQREIEKYKKMF